MAGSLIVETQPAGSDNYHRRLAVSPWEHDGNCVNINIRVVIKGNGSQHAGINLDRENAELLRDWLNEFLFQYEVR